MSSGIYGILNINNNKIYVGSSNKIRLREGKRGTGAALAREYSVSPVTICLIGQNKLWAEIEVE